MSYNWEGDMILHNTLIEKKRYVIGTAGTPIKADIREWISFEDNIVMKEVINQLIVEKKLPRSKNPGDFDRRAMILWDFVARNISYVHDSEKQSQEDFWLFPPEIYTLKQGDCEDGSFLLATLLITSGISPFCVRIVLGEVFNKKGRSIGSHCWPVYKNETGKWCILESTLDRIPSRFPPADNLAEKKQCYRYAPYYCFNNRHLWLIFPEDDRDAKMPKNLNRYLKLRRNKVNMKAILSPSN